MGGGLEPIPKSSTLPSTAENKECKCEPGFHHDFCPVHPKDWSVLNEGIDKEENGNKLLVEFKPQSVPGCACEACRKVIKGSMGNSTEDIDMSFSGFNGISKIIPNEDILSLQLSLRNKIYVRPYDLPAIESAAIKLCDAVVESKMSPSEKPTVDYENEAEKLYPYPKMCIDNEGEVARRIRNTLDKERAAHIRARQMSSPSDTNSKVKELVEWINQNYPLSIFKPIKEKANSLIQQTL